MRYLVEVTAKYTLEVESDDPQDAVNKACGMAWEYDADEMKVIFHCNCIVKGDIYLHCYRPTKDNEKEKEMFFESWFNTAAFPDVVFLLL